LINKTYIHSYCTIQPTKISLNQATIFEIQPTDFADFSKKAYQHFELGYPKFFKMDNMSKLALLGTEVLLNPIVDLEKENNIALLFANKSSSLDTDTKHQESINDPENYFPSPAVFVYTLPNICLGEISIKFQLKSENTFFIFDTLNFSFMENYARLLLNTKKADKVLCGWVEYFKEEYKGFFYLVSNEGTDGSIEHNKKNIEIAFNK
jgi:hypothetical protein